MKEQNYIQTWVEIDKKAFASNLKKIKTFAKGAEIIPVLKADAYGHGAVELAKEVQNMGFIRIAVFSMQEGIELRNAGIHIAILMLNPVEPVEALNTAVENFLVPTILDIKSLDFFDSIAKKQKRLLPFHLEVDTGMGRTGLSVSDTYDFLGEINKRKYAKMTGMYSHFAVSDTDKKFTQKQFEQFHAISRCARLKYDMRFISHIASSVGILKSKKYHLDAVRPGISLYEGGQPVLTWKTKIAYIKKVPSGFGISYGRTFITKKPSVIAAIPIGYCDGYNRLLSNKGFVLIKGKRCPVTGRVTMNMTMIDISALKNAAVGDEVVLLGRQGKQEVSAKEIADICKTISYEIFCNISPRIKRIMV
ncbi:MAG: alanine racemase [Elusimicrobiota bacterium]|jgi:alanine racemase|nr:alanine racemase [Elusimicrobiota bacterium]